MNTQSLAIKVARIYKVENGTALKAFVDIAVNDALLIKGIKLVEGKKGFFISMPAEQSKDNKWYENVRCLTPEMKQLVSDEIIEAYTQGHTVG